MPNIANPPKSAKRLFWWTLALIVAIAVSLLISVAITVGIIVGWIIGAYMQSIYLLYKDEITEFINSNNEV